MTLGCLKLPQARAELGLTLAALCCSSTEAKRSAAAAVAGPGAVPCRHALCPRVWLTAANPNVRGCCGAGFRLGQRCSTPAAARGPSAGTTRAATPHPVPRRSGSSRAGRARSLQAAPARSRRAPPPSRGWAGLDARSMLLLLLPPPTAARAVGGNPAPAPQCPRPAPTSTFAAVKCSTRSAHAPSSPPPLPSRRPGVAIYSK